MLTFDNTWYLPDGETHLQEWMTKVGDRKDGRLRYQGKKYDAALKHCKQRRIAVDVGGHVGLWSFWMAQDFKSVFAFEPHPKHQECWRENLKHAKNAALFAYALGAQEGLVSLETGPSSSGDTYVASAMNGTSRPTVKNVRMRRLDEFSFRDVDLLKIDCEGYEYFVLQGATELIERCQPVIVVEQKPGHGAKYRISDTAGAQWLKTMGYIQRQVIDGDVILTPPEVS